MYIGNVGVIKMCKIYNEIENAFNQYKNTMFDEIGKNIFERMSDETKVHFIKNHPSV